MTNLPIRSPSGYSPTVALAFSDTANAAQLVGAGAPLPVSISGGLMSSQSVIDSNGVYWLARDSGTTLTYMNWATSQIGTPVAPLTPAVRPGGEESISTSYHANVAGTGYRAGDAIAHVLILGTVNSPATVLVNAWANVTAGTILTSAPPAANLTEALPVMAMSSQATTASPLSGTQATNGLVGPFAAQTGREVWLTLSGTWTGSIQILRSTDGGVNKLGLTIGGQPWGTFNANCNEPISFESCANALYYLQASLVSGTVSYRIGQ